MIRICKDGKKKYVGLGYSVNPRHWDFQKQHPRSNCPNYEEIKILIHRTVQEYREKAFCLKSNDREFTANTLGDVIGTKKRAETVNDVFLEYIEQLDREGRNGYSKSVRQVYNSLVKYNGHLELFFVDIDGCWLKRYEQSLRRKGLAENTIGIRLRTLRAVYNYAIEKGVASADKYPFKQYKVSRLQQETVKRALRKDDFERIINYVGKDKYQQFAIDIFAFTYYIGGINFVDIANLTVKNIQDGQLVYRRQKTFGRALLVAGSEGMAGASVLSARAALRSGAGLLTLHIPRCNNDILQRSVPEAMTLPDTAEKQISTTVATTKYSAVAVGPGVGQAPATEKALLELFSSCTVPMVVDADALNILARNKEFLACLPQGSIITPHIGEFTRLAGECGNSYDRLQRAVQVARDNNICVVLKGAYTAVVTPQGDVHFNTTGNAGMATAGSGDTLTGILLALLAQGLSAVDAARLGVYVHGAAGDIAAAKVGQIALVASDIIDALPAAWDSLK